MFKNLLAALAMMSVLAAPAHAADIATKAPVSWLKGYPYDSSGLFVGIITQGGGGSVAANVPGVTSASLTTTSASIGATIGYGWGSKNSLVAYSAEASFMATNFNGSNAGFALTGPVTIDTVVMAWTPVSVIQNAFGLLNIPNPFNSIPPFPATPAGLTANNVQIGFGGGAVFQDMTLAYQGVGSNKVWEIAPMIEIALMEQLSNGSAVREFIKTDFPTKGTIFGAHQSSATPSTEVKAGIQVLF
jgi:hypothetical protein